MTGDSDLHCLIKNRAILPILSLRDVKSLTVSEMQLLANILALIFISCNTSRKPSRRLSSRLELDKCSEIVATVADIFSDTIASSSTRIVSFNSVRISSKWISSSGSKSSSSELSHSTTSSSSVSLSSE